MITVYEMQYTSNIVQSDMKLIPFNDKFYDMYKSIYNECFYEMREALNVKPYNFCYSIEQMKDKKANILLLLKDNDVIGSVACIGNEIDDLIVNKKYQRQGYGEKLLLFAISNIQKQNIKPITLHVTKWNKNAVRLYKKCGFECIHVEEIV